MKKIKFLLMGTFLICIINFSCKKDSVSDTTTVEYKVSPIKAELYTIQYRDTANVVQKIQDPALHPSEFPNGSLSLPASKNLKGFIAFLRVWTNPTTVDINLKILVNGKVKKDTTILANDYHSGGGIEYQIP